MVEDGDIIDIDIPNRSLNIRLSQDEIQKRLEKWQPKETKAKGFLGLYSRNVNSSSKGAVLE